MGNNVHIGSNNKIKETNIAGSNIQTTKPEKKNNFLTWFLKHLETIIAAAISGAVSAFVAWLITYLCLK